MTIKRQSGFAMIPNVIARSGRLNPNSLAVYVCLKSHAGTTNKTWVSHKTISKEIKLSVSAVKTALNQLKDVGLIDWQGRIRPTDGGMTSNDYRIFDSERHLARHFLAAPQSSKSYQEEEPIEEESIEKNHLTPRLQNGDENEISQVIKNRQQLNSLNSLGSYLLSIQIFYGLSQPPRS